LYARYIAYVNLQKNVESEVRNIISDELQKLKHSVEGKEDQEMDVTWEYQEPQVVWPADIDGEDVLLEMERLLYEDLREESIRKGTIRLAFANSSITIIVNGNLLLCILC
jgi:hypothetical protein